MIELEKMLKDLYLLSGLNMSIFDLNQNLLASYPHKKSKFCNEIGKNKKSYQHCLDCDYKAMEHVKESGELYIYKCHFGLNEAIMPLYSYGVLTGYLMMGQAVIGTYRNYSEIIEKSKEYFDDQEKLKKYVTKIAILNEDQVYSFANICDIYAKYISLTNRVQAKHDNLAQEVKKYIISSKVSFKNILKHTIKSFIYFVPGIVNTIFTSADKTVLGAFANSYEVGVYEQASKICTLCGSVINSISNVVLPRVTYLNNNASKDKSKKIMFKTLRYASVVAIAVTVGIICISDEFVPVFFGLGYEKSAVLLKILAFNVLMSILANYIGQQCLISNAKQNQYNIAISVGALLNVILNFFMVERFQSVGVSVASVVSSGVLFWVVLMFSREIISLRNIIQMDWKATIAAIIMFITIYRLNFTHLFVTLAVKIAVGAVVYIAILVILREETIQEVFVKIISKRRT